MKWEYRMQDGPSGLSTGFFSAKDDEELIIQLRKIMKDIESGRFLNVHIQINSSYAKILERIKKE
jgi:hypothetical protein